jgi:3-dehydroquinate synthase
LKTLNYHNTPIYISESYLNVSNYLPNSDKTIFLVDEHVFHCDKYIFKSFNTIVIPSGEQQKSMAFIEELVSKLLDLGADRTYFLVGVGGGVVCDITGFVASIFMRGIKFGFVPTTLLAQVDASIGGKNGVNTGVYKNMIGTITQPEFILIDEIFLSSLPQEEIINGLAEIIKHACIQDKSYLNFIAQNLSAIFSLEKEILGSIITTSVIIKTDIVHQDEKEKGVRKILNFGHTFGHAIEKKYGIPHGRAVSLGMIIANKIAVFINKLDLSSEKIIKDLLENTGLPTDISQLDLQSLKELVFKDKKKSGSSFDFILLNKIGEAKIISFSLSQLDDIILQLQ